MHLTKLLSAVLLLSFSMGVVSLSHARAGTAAGGLNAKLLDKVDAQDNAKQDAQVHPEQEHHK